MIHLEAVVRGGIVPLPIKVYINNIDNDEQVHFTRDGSFKDDYILPTGRYSVLVGGMNPEGGSTTVTLGGDIKVGPLPKPSFTSGRSMFSAIFYMEI